MFPEKVPGLTLRLGVSDIETRNGSLWQKKTPPNYAYIRYEGQSTAGQELGIVDEELGMRNFVYSETKLDHMALFIAGEALTVGFNRTSGGTDLEFELPIVGSKIYLDVVGCFVEMFTDQATRAN